jgi:hypothetical protein
MRQINALVVCKATKLCELFLQGSVSTNMNETDETLLHVCSLIRQKVLSESPSNLEFQQTPLDVAFYIHSFVTGEDKARERYNALNLFLRKKGANVLKALERREFKKGANVLRRFQRRELGFF